MIYWQTCIEFILKKISNSMCIKFNKYDEIFQIFAWCISFSLFTFLSFSIAFYHNFLGQYLLHLQLLILCWKKKSKQALDKWKRHSKKAKQSAEGKSTGLLWYSSSYMAENAGKFPHRWEILFYRRILRILWMEQVNN